MCIGCEYQCCSCYHCRSDRYLKYACFKCCTSCSRQEPKYEFKPGTRLYFINPDAAPDETNITICAFEPKEKVSTFSRVAKCGSCSQPMTRLGPADKIPKQTDHKGWQRLSDRRQSDYGNDLYKHLDRQSTRVGVA